MHAKCADKGRFEVSTLEFQGGFNVFNVLWHNFLIYCPILAIQTSMETGEANQYSQGGFKGEGGGGGGKKGRKLTKANFSSYIVRF